MVYTIAGAQMIRRPGHSGRKETASPEPSLAERCARNASVKTDERAGLGRYELVVNSCAVRRACFAM